MKRSFFLVTVILLLTLLVSCKKGDGSIENVTVILDWVPNTNHTGLYAAQEMGYFREQNLNVFIIQPSEGSTVELVAGGKGDFGISYQEEVTYARTASTPMPVKAVAAIIQHNSSGFASPKNRHIISPADFSGKIYGGWGSPVEEMTLRTLMSKYGKDFNTIQIKNLGAVDFFTSIKKEIDFGWIFYGWDGIAAEVKNVELNFIDLKGEDSRFDYYTPVIIAGETTLQNKQSMAKKFIQAAAKGYRYAILEPEKAAEILLKNAPELDREIVLKSQKFLASRYQDDAPRWGQMELKRWKEYADWMKEQKLIEKPLDAENAFTNEFLSE